MELCTICQEPHTDDSLVVPKCEHKFHKTCLGTHLKRCLSIDLNCPNCRTTWTRSDIFKVLFPTRIKDKYVLLHCDDTDTDMTLYYTGTPIEWVYSINYNGFEYHSYSPNSLYLEYYLKRRFGIVLNYDSLADEWTNVTGFDCNTTLVHPKLDIDNVDIALNWVMADTIPKALFEFLLED